MSKFRKIVENIVNNSVNNMLLEAKQVGLLYHSTTTDGLKAILTSNKMTSYQHRGIAFSSDKMEFFGEYPVELVVDGNKLSENYKVTRLQPDFYEVNVVGRGKKPLYLTGDEDHDDELYHQMTPDDDPHVVNNIKNYIVGFVVNKAYCETQEEVQELYKIINTYCPHKEIEVIDTENTNGNLGRGYDNNEYRVNSIKKAIESKIKPLIDNNIASVNIEIISDPNDFFERKYRTIVISYFSNINNSDKIVEDAISEYKTEDMFEEKTYKKGSNTLKKIFLKLGIVW